MTESLPTIEHPSRRLVVTVPWSYDDARARYEALVPNYHPAAFAAATSWQDALVHTGREAPHVFLIYPRLDITSMLAGSSSTGKATDYLMGNHTIAETMFRHDPAVMLHAPLPTLIIEDRSGVT